MSRTDARRGGTEGVVRLPHRGAGVSRGHSRSKLSVRSSGTLTRKGRNSQGSHDRERAAEGPNDREGESASRLRGDRRPRIQYPLAFLTEGRGETSDADQEGTESPLAKRETQSPATGESHCRTLNSIEPPWYGPVCPVVWEGRSREAPPYPHLSLEGRNAAGSCRDDRVARRAGAWPASPGTRPRSGGRRAPGRPCDSSRTKINAWT